MEESNESTQKKFIYTIPFDQQPKIPALLKALEDNFDHIYVDIEMNSLEDAYVNIAKAEEKLHEGERQIPEFLRDDDLENNPMFIRYL